MPTTKKYHSPKSQTAFPCRTPWRPDPLTMLDKQTSSFARIPLFAEFFSHHAVLMLNYGTESLLSHISHSNVLVGLQLVVDKHSIELRFKQKGHYIINISADKTTVNFYQVRIEDSSIYETEVYLELDNQGIRGRAQKNLVQAVDELRYTRQTEEQDLSAVQCDSYLDIPADILESVLHDAKIIFTKLPHPPSLPQTVLQDRAFEWKLEPKQAPMPIEKKTRAKNQSCPDLSELKPAVVNHNRSASAPSENGFFTSPLTKRAEKPSNLSYLLKFM